MSNVYVIAGATGHVGSGIAQGLLAAGKKVRVIGRSSQSLAKFQGAEQRVGQLDDPAFVREAFAGASYAFAMIPPAMEVKTGFRDWQRKVAQSLADAVSANKLTHVVTLSSVGAHLSDGNGPVAGLHDMEAIFNRLAGVNVLHLRPAFFMENNFQAIGMIKTMGMYGTPTAAEVPVPMIACADIAQAGLDAMLTLKFEGHAARELLGPRDVTLNEVTRALGAAVGKPGLQYVAFPYEDAVGGMVKAGLPEERARMYVELSRGFNEGKVKPTQARGPLTNTPTTIEQFAQKVFAPAFNAP
jgi:uncharacterized protein YbjT (DUF2867 family)